MFKLNKEKYQIEKIVQEFTILVKIVKDDQQHFPGISDIEGKSRLEMVEVIFGSDVFPVGSKYIASIDPYCQHFQMKSEKEDQIIFLLPVSNILISAKERTI